MREICFLSWKCLTLRSSSYTLPTESQRCLGWRESLAPQDPHGLPDDQERQDEDHKCHLQGTSIANTRGTLCCAKSGPVCEAEVWVLPRRYHDSCILDESACDAEVGGEEPSIVKSSGAMCAYPRETWQISVMNCRNPVHGLN